ncbi:BGTF surface domain-containing protein [Halobellus salinus]|uniref:BGTF surface domain-containing protein n=1 Tax=Halobellus salinus TaxID=931585 RepID=UPI0016634359|nr:BGTF surface domain-containing protein [Halobellus salinus]
MLQISEEGSINATYSDESAGENRVTKATIKKKSKETDSDPDPLSLGPVTELSTGSLNGTSLTHTESVIEVPFSEDVSQAGEGSGGLTLGGNITVAVDGENVTDRYVLDADGAADGQVVVTSATPVGARAEVTVAVDAANDSADAETITPGAVDATVTDATVAEGDDANVYDNETVAFVAAEPNRAFDVSNATGAFVFTGRTGNGSQVFAFDTAARNWTGEHTIESTASGGSIAATTGVTLRELGLSVGVTDRNITTAEGIDARVSAADSGRAVDVALVAADDTIVDRRNRTLGGNGGATVEFGADSLAGAGPGNYTVNVTDAVTGTGVDSAPIRAVDADARTAAFGSTVVAEHAGDVAVFDLEFQYADTATVTLGGSDVGFRANATVEDRDGDGRVRLRFNTAAAATLTTLPDDGGAVFATAPAGNASDTTDAVIAADTDDRGAPSEALAPGEYGVTIRPGSNASTAETGVGTLTLRQPSPQRLDTWVAPADTTFGTAAEVSAAVEGGRLTTATAVATGDVAVHRVVAPGIAGALANTSGDTTEAFFELAGTDATDRYALNVTQRNPAANEDPYRLTLNNTTARVVADAVNDTYFVTYRGDGPAAVPWNGTAATGSADPDDPAPGDSLSAEFTVHDGGPFADLAPAERRVTAAHSLVAARVDADPPVVVTNATNQSIGGTTTLAPGTEFELRVQSSNGTEPRFLKTARATVGPAGGWNATVDFDAQHVGDTFTVQSTVDTVVSADDLAVDGEVRATLPQNTSTPTAQPTTTAAAGGAGGGIGAGGGGGGDDDRDRDTPSPEPTATATPTQSTDADESVVDSAQQYLGDAFATAVNNTDAESIRDRLFDFDVAVAVAALTVVVVYVSRRG